MHRTYRVDVKKIIKAKNNVLKLNFTSAVKYAQQCYDKNPNFTNSDTLDGFSHVRKAHCDFGWDWGPKMPDIGIWRPIQLEAFSHSKINDYYITQKHYLNKVKISCKLDILQFQEEKLECKLILVDPLGKSFSKDKINLNSTIDIEIENPHLWYPNGYGEQNLYKVKLELFSNGVICDLKNSE